MCNINHPKFPSKEIRGIFKTDESWYCIECCSTISSFNYLSSNKNFLACCTDTDSNIRQWKDLGNDHDSSLLLKPSNSEILVNQFNNTTQENGNNPEKIAWSKYYEIDEMHNIEIPHKNKPLSLFRINTCSLNKNFDDLQHLLSCTKNFFDIVAVSETRITKNVFFIK